MRLPEVDGQGWMLTLGHPYQFVQTINSKLYSVQQMLKDQQNLAQMLSNLSVQVMTIQKQSVPTGGHGSTEPGAEKDAAPIQPGIQHQERKSDLSGSAVCTESALHKGSGVDAPRDPPLYANAGNAGGAVGGTVTSNRPANISFEPYTGASLKSGGSSVARD